MTKMHFLDFNYTPNSPDPLHRNNPDGNYKLKLRSIETVEFNNNKLF